MNVQVIEKDGKPEWAVIPYEAYQELIAQADMLQDVHAYDAVKQAIAAGQEELVPAHVAYALLDQNAIKVWREYRGLSQQALAAAVGISKPYLSQLEVGKRAGSTAVLQAIAAALNLTIDDVIPSDLSE